MGGYHATGKKWRKEECNAMEMRGKGCCQCDLGLLFSVSWAMDAVSVCGGGWIGFSRVGAEKVNGR